MFIIGVIYGLRIKHTTLNHCEPPIYLYTHTHLESGQILDKVVGGVVHELKELILLRVLVLVQETLNLVHHSAGIVQYAKLLFPVATVAALDVVGMLFQQLMLLHQVRFVCAL